MTIKQNPDYPTEIIDLDFEPNSDALGGWLNITIENNKVYKVYTLWIGVEVIPKLIQQLSGGGDPLMMESVVANWRRNAKHRPNRNVPKGDFKKDPSARFDDV
jgi:hypothetical protein